VEGFLNPLLRRLGEIRPGLGATVIGAGGAARAVVCALARSGVRPLILNRSVQRARGLAEDFGCRGGGLDQVELIQGHNELIVQTTSVGMEPAVEGDPLPDYRFNGSELVYDLVYKPQLTVFLKRAEAAGCTVIPGREMLDRQAEIQFKLFTGQDYPPC